MDTYIVTEHTLKNTLGLGVAGNFAGHLEQAGETPDFIQVKTTESQAPKGLFPFYIPHTKQALGTYPYSSTQLLYPAHLANNAHLQAEPEVGVLFAVNYESNQVSALNPLAFTAFNDCSIRQPGAKKISDKKNWGPNSKGMAEKFIPLTNFTKGCEIDSFRIASFLQRNGQTHAYGTDSSVLTYSYFHDQLMQWMLEKLNQQADFGPLESMPDLLQQAGLPKHILISLGATNYTTYGETTFLQPGDAILVYVYNANTHTPEAIQNHALKPTQVLEDALILHQNVKPAF